MFTCYLENFFLFISDICWLGSQYHSCVLIFILFLCPDLNYSNRVFKLQPDFDRSCVLQSLRIMWTVTLIWCLGSQLVFSKTWILFQNSLRGSDNARVKVSKEHLHCREYGGGEEVDHNSKRNNFEYAILHYNILLQRRQIKKKPG